MIYQVHRVSQDAVNDMGISPITAFILSLLFWAVVALVGILNG